ncbi:hypothetical protein F5Y02DRAFT_90736 [Annulohypoxylon stygium]|nr:hypothetical protein F5Y02DRAFT_90736 [Annulohypoxylon stygium]
MYPRASPFGLVGINRFHEFDKTLSSTVRQCTYERPPDRKIESVTDLCTITWTPDVSFSDSEWIEEGDTRNSTTMSSSSRSEQLQSSRCISMDENKEPKARLLISSTIVE